MQRSGRKAGKQTCLPSCAEFQEHTLSMSEIDWLRMSSIRRTSCRDVLRGTIGKSWPEPLSCSSHRSHPGDRKTFKSSSAPPAFLNEDGLPSQNLRIWRNLFLTLALQRLHGIGFRV